jgi:hypothetical protein
VVEPRRAQIRAGKVEAGKIEAGKALAGEIGPMPAGRRLKRRFHLDPCHLGRRHVRRGQVEAPHGVLRVSGESERDCERKREQALRQSHGELFFASATKNPTLCFVAQRSLSLIRSSGRQGRRIATA